MSALEADFEAFLLERGLSLTRRRQQIARHMAREVGHPTLQEFTAAVRAADPTVGEITVYRTIRLLEEAGLVEKVSLGGVERYERAGAHHDHLVCVDCGRVLEVHEPAIESRQAQIAARFGFRLTGHDHVLRGRCVRTDCDGRDA